MAFNPGRNAGRVSIRVVPDTRLFRRETQQQLERATAGLKAKVRIDGVILDRTKMRADIERQVQALGGVKVDAEGVVTVDRVRLNRPAVRKSLQHEFNQMSDVIVKVAARISNPKRFEQDVRDLVNRASKNEVSIDVTAHTELARTNIAVVARDRIVNLFVKVSQSSVQGAMTTLAALSGARLAWNWTDRIRDFAENLDKSLPSILGWTTAITGLSSALFAGTAEIVALGQGLVAMTPALLVVPGILMNAVGSLTAFVVAMRDAKEQLSPLKDDMGELADIITSTYWDRARQPILDLVTGLMPQLRTSFAGLSEGIGDFTASLSNELAADLADGRLEGIFKNVADGWRILADGADGIAGALVSLSQIGAQYTPRLATWFTRQAKTFSDWLDAIANDGRLDVWMEGAIDSMYDLWDLTKNTSGVLEGLFQAADKAGAGGIRGLADLMGSWERTVKSDGVQRGLSTIFAGAKDAMSSIGDGLSRFMGMVGGLAPQVAGLMRSTADFAGGLIGGFSDAMNSPAWRAGLDKFNRDLLIGLDRIEPSMRPIADLFGRFMGTLGEMSKTLLPTAFDAFAGLAPVLEAIIDNIEPVLRPLGDAVSDVIEVLSPTVTRLVDAIGPGFQDVMRGFADAVVGLAPVVDDFLGGVVDMIDGLGAWSDTNRGFFNDLALNVTPDEEKWRVKIEQQAGARMFNDRTGKRFDFYKDWANPADVRGAAETIADELEKIVGNRGKTAGRAFLDELKRVDMPPEIMSELERRWGTGLRDALGKAGQAANHNGGGGGMSLFLTREIEGALPALSNGMDRVQNAVKAKMSDSDSWLGPAGGAMVGGLLAGVTARTGEVGGTVASGLGGSIRGGMTGSELWLNPAGSAVVTGFVGGANARVGAVGGILANGLGGSLRGGMAGAGGWLDPYGRATIDGYRLGANAAIPAVSGVVGGVRGVVVGGVSGISLYGVGQNLMYGMRDGISSAAGSAARAAANAALSALNAAKRALDIHSPSRRARREVGQMWGAGLALGIEDSTKEIRRAAGAASDISYTGTPGTGARTGTAATAKRNVNLTIVNPVVKDLQQEAREAADLANAVV